MESARSRVEPGDEPDRGVAGGLDAAPVGDRDAARDRGSADIPLFDAEPVDAAPVDAEPVDAEPVDAEPVDADVDGAAPDGAVPRFCHTTYTLVPREEHRVDEPFVDGDEVYVSDRGPDGALRAVRLRDGAPVGGPADTLIAVRGGVFLLARPDGDGGRRLIYRDRVDQPLAERFTVAATWIGTSWRPPQWVEPGHAIWLDGDRLFEWRPGAPATPRGDLVEAAGLDDGLVAWIEAPERDGPQVDWWLITRTAAGDERRVGPLPRPLAASLRVTAGHVWWLTAADGVPVSYAIGADAPVRHPVMRCTELDAEADRAVAICEGAGDRLLMALRPGAAPVERAAAPQIAGPRIHAGMVSYAAYNDAGAWCDAGPAARGAVYWESPDGRPNGLARVEIESGCLCCGAFWPQLVMEHGDDVLAWNYGHIDVGRAAIGIARRECE